jgi:plastocyanin
MVGGVSFTGADQGTPLGTSASATGLGAASPATATVNVSSAADEIVIDSCCGDASSGVASSSTVVVGAGQTMRWEQENAATNQVCGTQSTEPGAGTVTMSEVITTPGDTVDWAIMGVSVKVQQPPVRPLVVISSGLRF